MRARLGARRFIGVAAGAALATVSLAGTGWFGDPTASAEVPTPGLVAEAQTGYFKAYRYDSRLRANKPPYFSGTASMSIPDARVTDYLFFTNFEQGDPQIFGAPKECEGKYYSEWGGKYPCTNVLFVGGDRIEGPFHTNDAARVEGGAEFGRAGANPPDVVEIYGGTYPEDLNGQCVGKPIFHTATNCYVQGERIALPEATSGLASFVEGEDAFAGETRLELDGTRNTIRVVNFNASGRESAKTIGWPSSGLIYVHSESCGWPTATSNVVSNADGPEEAGGEKGCGNVYVRGTYRRPLTIAASEDLIIDGSIYPTSVAGRLGAEPSGSDVLGLVAGNYVRVYHPCGSGGNETGSLENPWIYAAILSAAHSFIVDNFNCGSGLGKLGVYGSIAENYRGPVGTGIVGSIVGRAISAPPGRVCVSRRRFAVHVTQIPGLKYRRINVVLNGHRVATRTTRRGITATVDLRGLPKGTYVLRITVETTHGRKITGTRTYRTCAATPNRPKRRPKL